MTSTKFEHLFPYDEIRPQQDEAIRFALDALQKQNKRFVILELGTGCGKSAIGVTLAKYFNENRAEDDDRFKSGAYFLTTQKVLQDQYIKDFGPPKGGMVSIKSSANYKCHFYRKQSCAESLRMLRGEPRGTPFFKSCTFGCVYKEAKRQFMDAPLSVTNFPYFLAETNYSGKIVPRDFLVIDEAHGIETQLSKFVEITFSEKFAKDILRLDWPTEKTQAKVIKWVRDEYQPRLAKYVKHIKDILDKFAGQNDAEKSPEVSGFAKQYSMLDKHICKVNRFLGLYDKDNWVLNLIEPMGRASNKFEFKPVDISPYSEDLLFRNGKKVLMMSATIINHDIFCESLGLDPNDVAFLTIDSPFPIENKPIFYCPVGKMSAATIEASLPKMAATVRELLKQHKNEKGLIHCHTFKIAKYLKDNVKSRRLLIHTSDNRDEIIKKHLESDKPTVLLSPSSTEGIDLHGDLSRFQIICKVPYPYLGDKIVRKRMNKNKKWYPFQTTKTIIQSTGRSIRSETDHAVTYILDENWTHFYRSNGDMFPQSFKDALQS